MSKGIYLRHGNYCIDYYHNGKRIREMIGPDKHLAELVLNKRRVEIAEGKFLDIRKKSKIKFQEFGDEYLDVHSKVNNRSWRTFDRSNLKHLKRYFSGKFLDEISPPMIEKMKAELLASIKPASVNRVVALLKSIYNKAIAWGKFDGKNPVKGIKLYKEVARTRFLEKEEISRLIGNSSEHLKPIIVLAINTGMRRGEIFNLKWSDVDFKRGILHLYETKNGEKREVPLNQLTQEMLLGLKRNPDSQYVFPSKDGNSYEDIRKSFFTACKKSGIINFRFHDLRHSFASQLVMSGVDLNTVRELLGHKSLEMTLRYSHLSPDHKKRAVDILNAQLVTGWSLNGSEPELTGTATPPTPLKTAS